VADGVDDVAAAVPGRRPPLRISNIPSVPQPG